MTDCLLHYDICCSHSHEATRRAPRRGSGGAGGVADAGTVDPWNAGTPRGFNIPMIHWGFFFGGCWNRGVNKCIKPSYYIYICINMYIYIYIIIYRGISVYKTDQWWLVPISLYELIIKWLWDIENYGIFVVNPCRAPPWAWGCA